MKIMICPLNGPRNIAEFSYGGEVRECPASGSEAAALADYLFLKDNQPGVTREWWCHLPTTTWFIAERDLATGEVLRTYPASALSAEGGA